MNNADAFIEKDLLNKTKDKLLEARKNASDLYKKMELAKTREDSANLIEYYKKIIGLLKEIKEESHSLDNIEVPLECLESDDIIQEERIKNCNEIMAHVQHIRGCKESFNNYNHKIEVNK